jgi:glycosyltransferase involved in cell wall biosynthesis
MTATYAGGRTRAIGVIVPVHNEEELLPHALEAIDRAFVEVGGRGIACRSVIVLDNCSDSSAMVVRRWVKANRRHRAQHDPIVIRSHWASVGKARRAGSTALLRTWVDIEPQHIWLATTDADSRVPSDWLVTQLDAHEQGADLWAGRVVVDDWSPYDPSTAARWEETYENEAGPIHGANLGFNAQTYVDAGGFLGHVTGEDRALYQAIVARGGRTHHDSVVKVITSARRTARAPLGFASVLEAVECALESEPLS